MSSSFNQVTLLGHVANDPVFFQGKEPKHNRLLFSLACNRINSTKADFVPCTLWGKLADAGAQYIGKGKRLHINGSISTHWDPEKQKSTVGVKADSVIYLSNSTKNQKVETATDSMVAKIKQNAPVDKEAIIKALIEKAGYAEEEARLAVEETVLSNKKELAEIPF